ncbi:peptide chain release factor N(5)-glutamine methyltransferase [Thermodesulfobacteriota bacterium]
MARQKLWTIKQVLQWTADYFQTKAIPSARLDAELLLAHALNKDRVHLYMNLDQPLSPDEREIYRAFVRRRAGREPVALILGSREFWSMTLEVVPGILIPRPETETLVETVLQEIAGVDELSILEIGTGSGAVALALAKEAPAASLIATDIDPAAVQLARSNARAVGVGESIRFVACDLFCALRSGGRFNVICSNPPYIPEDVLPSLEPEITYFEPARALAAGPKGLDVIERIAAEAPDFLRDDGSLIMEIGDDQPDAVTEILLSEERFTDVKIIRDLAGKPRVVKARRVPAGQPPEGPHQ